MSPRESSTTGLDPHVAAALAYLAGPVSGLLLLLAEKTNTYVRFHAWQSVLGLGGLGILVAVLLGLAAGSLIVSATAFRALLVVGWITWLLWILLWGVCLVQAFTRRRWKMPIAGTYAERLTARSTTRTS